MTITRTAVAEKIAERIRAAGRITFAEFMEHALYDPDDGYYARAQKPPGPGGDYYTSPKVHPEFGRALYDLFLAMAQRQEGPFTVVEVGAGDGAAAQTILRAVRQRPWPAGFRYLCVEKSPGMRRRIADALADFPDVRILDNLEAVGKVSGCIWSNELFDSLPFHRVMVENGELRELYVTLDSSGDFVEEPGPPSSDELKGYFWSVGVAPPEGCRTEVRLEAIRMIQQMSEALERGWLLTLDYGYSAQEYYAPERPNGTLLCYHGHRTNAEPFEWIGEQDITAQVDFTGLAVAAQARGLEVLSFTDVTSFFYGLGVGQRIGGADAVKERAALISLVHPEGPMSNYYALLLGRSATAAGLPGFSDNRLGLLGLPR